MSTKTSAPTVRDRIRRELDRGNSMQPQDVAAAVMIALPTDDYEAALRAALPALVREVIVSSRPSAQAAIERATSPAPTRAPVGRSWKRDGKRELFQRELMAIYSTPTGNKRLGDFTYEDLLNLADTCRDLAKANSGRADKYEALAGAMRSAGVETLSGLPAEVLAAEFGGAR